MALSARLSQGAGRRPRDRKARHAVDGNTFELQELEFNWGEMSKADADNVCRELHCAAIAAFPSPVIVSTLDRLLYANAAAASFLEAKSTSDLTGRAMDSFIHGACIEASRMRRSLIVATGQRVGPVTVKALTCAHHCRLVTMDSWPIQVVGETLIATIIHGSSAPSRPMLVHGDVNPMLMAVSEVLLDQMPMPIAVHGNPKIVFTNAALRRCMCDEGGGRLEGRPFSDFVHEDARAAGEERRRMMGPNRQSLHDIRLKLVALDGTPRYAKCSAVTIVVEDEPHIMLVFDSITLTPTD